MWLRFQEIVDNVSKNTLKVGDESLMALVVLAWQTLSVAFNYCICQGLYGKEVKAIQLGFHSPLCGLH